MEEAIGAMFQSDGTLATLLCFCDIALRCSSSEKLLSPEDVGGRSSCQKGAARKRFGLTWLLARQETTRPA